MESIDTHRVRTSRRHRATACDEEDWPVQGEGAAAIDDSINGQALTYLADNGLPGATLAVTRTGRLVWSKAYGWADTDKPWSSIYSGRPAERT